MKLIQRLSLLASIALVAIACDIQQTFDDRINDKQLLVLAPDFADTSVQLVFRDPETLAVIDEDFEVTVYANKRLIDANGNYKNEFIARGGVMEFFVSPEETVSEGDPLEIAVEAVTYNNVKQIPFYSTTIKKKGLSSLMLAPISIPSDVGLASNQFSSNEKKENNLLISKELKAPKLTIRFNGQIIENGVDYSGARFYGYGNYDLDDGFGYRNIIGVGRASKLTEPLEISVSGPISFFDYALELKFLNEDGAKVLYTVDNSGYTTYRRYIKSGGSYSLFAGDEGFDPSYNHLLGIAEGVEVLNILFYYYYERDLKSCPIGFNLQIEGLKSGEETNLIYKATRDASKSVFAFASLNVNTPSFLYNSLQDGNSTATHYISKYRNTLEFAENAQYYIEPQTIELGGEELCGNTYTVKLIPKENHSKYNLNLSMRCEEDEVGVAPTFSALYRKKGGDEASWETVSFKKGSTSLYLEEGAVYEVKGTFSERAFEFEFTNEVSKIAEAVSGTRNGNTAVKDITYTIESGDTGSQSINANVVFYAADCLIN